MKQILFIIFILLVSNASVNAQQKVSSQFSALLYSPSIIANGMGDAGAAVIADNNYFFNPGILGLLTFENKIYLASYPNTNIGDSPVKYFNGRFAHPFRLSEKYRLNIAYSYVKLSNDVTQRTYGRGTDSSYTYISNYSDRFHNITLSIGYDDEDYQIGFGLSLKYINDDIGDVSINAVAFDLGYAVALLKEGDLSKSSQYIWKLKPVLGVAYCNLGPNIKYPSNNEISLPKVLRVGGSIKFEIAKQLKYRQWSIVSATPTLEFEKRKDYDRYQKYGVEFSLLNAFYLRTGKFDSDQFYFTSVGYSLSLNGFVASIRNISNSEEKLHNNILSKIDIVYSYAKKSSDNIYYNENSTKEILVSYRLNW